MFTGIIEEIGKIQNIKKGTKSSVLNINGNKIFEDIHVGDSIAVNGVCLTVTSFAQNTFTADVMNETLSRSSLGSLKIGSFVNLERAMLANGRFGGHIVSGHIDGVGEIIKIEKDDNAIWYTIGAEDKLMKYIVEKGSIAIDGISLTVAKVDNFSFSVSIIPHTAKETILSHKSVGDIVNLENDVIGKEVIESYLYDIVGQLDTISWISPEIAYKKGKANLLTSDVIAAEGDAVIFYDTKAITPSLKLRKFDAAEIEDDIKIYAEDVIQIYNQINNYLDGLFQLDKAYSKENIYGIVVVLEDAVVSRKKVYEKVCNILQDAINVSEEEKNYICSHIKILPLRAIECMILQNTSILPELKEQLDKPEKWYYYTYTNTTIENGIISSYAQYEQDLKGRIRKQG